MTVQHKLSTARNRSVFADGAQWIWDVAENVCPDGKQVVNWSRAVEHLYKATLALYPNELDIHEGSERSTLCSAWQTNQ